MSPLPGKTSDHWSLERKRKLLAVSFAPAWLLNFVRRHGQRAAVPAVQDPQRRRRQGTPLGSLVKVPV
jgi:hypothetical protein